MKCISDLLKSSGLFVGLILVLVSVGIWVTGQPINYEVIILFILGVSLTWFFGIRSFLKLEKNEKRTIVLTIFLISLVILILLIFYFFVTNI